MAYNTKPIAKDVDGNPISQYYNPETDQYEPVEGKNGANKVLVMNNDLSLQPILDKLDQLTGTVIDEETRKSNEIERQNNEQNRIQLYNALLAELERIEQIEQQVPESVLEAVDNLKNEIGNLLELQTNEKSNLIGAINEINQKVENIEVVDMEAINVSYDNAESGLAANNIQEAIDEINTKIDEIEIVDMDAVNVSYDNTESEIEAENVQDAIDEINENLTAHLADNAPHGATSEATGNRIMLRDAGGSVKFNSDFSSTDALKNQGIAFYDAVTSAYTTGQTIISEKILENGGVYLLFTKTGISANSGTSGMYLVRVQGTEKTIRPILEDSGGISLSINADNKIEITNTSGSHRTLQFSLIRVG